MNTEDSKTNEVHRFRLSLADKLNFKNSSKNMALADWSINYTWEIIKSAYNNNKFKISASTWSDKFDLSDACYYIADIQDYHFSTVFFFWRYLNSSMTSFFSNILFPLPNVNDLNSHVSYTRPIQVKINLH